MIIEFKKTNEIRKLYKTRKGSYLQCMQWPKKEDDAKCEPKCEYKIISREEVIQCILSEGQKIPDNLLADHLTEENEV